MIWDEFADICRNLYDAHMADVTRMELTPPSRLELTNAVLDKSRFAMTSTSAVGARLNEVANPITGTLVQISDSDDNVDWVTFRLPGVDKRVKVHSWPNW